MEIQYGCECNHGKCTIHNKLEGFEYNYNRPASESPVVLVVERAGVEIKVCSECQLSTDKKVKLLVDENTDLSVFDSYDSLGGLCIAMYLKDGLHFEKASK